MNNILKYAELENIPIIQKDGLDFLINFIKENNIKTILEIGSAIGYSAINMALVDTNIKVVTIERDLVRYNEAVKNIQEMNLSNQIEILNIDAFTYSPVSEFDLLFIDGAKSQNEKFFHLFKDKCKYIITDNLNFHGMVYSDKIKNRNTRQLVRKIEKYIQFLKENEEYKTEFYEVGDGMSVSIRR